MNRNTETEEQKAAPIKGVSLLENLRKNEKERQSSYKNTPFLGEIAKWKKNVKPKPASKTDSEVNIESTSSNLKPASLSFKDALDSMTKVNNDSEISFKQSNVNVAELCGMISTFQADITNSNVASNDVVEFKCLLEKLNSLCSKPKNISVSHCSDDKVDSK